MRRGYEDHATSQSSTDRMSTGTLDIVDAVPSGLLLALRGLMLELEVQVYLGKRAVCQCQTIESLWPRRMLEALMMEVRAVGRRLDK